MTSRRNFLSFCLLAASMLSGKSWASSATKQRLNSEDLMQIDSKGQITLLHITDLHGQLNPIFYRAPSQNYGVGNYENIPPHLIGEAFLSHFGINESTPLAYAHTMLNYVELAKEYGRLGGLDRVATVVKMIRAERGDNRVLLLDGGDTWQGSYTSLMTQGLDVVSTMKLLKPDAMVGHWEFTFGKSRLEELIGQMNCPFLGGNVFDTEWDEPVFESTAYYEKGGVSVAVIGQHFPYTPIANPKHLVEGWSFGIRVKTLQQNVEKAREKGAKIIVLLSHNGFDVDRKIANLVTGIDVILTGHTHDAIPHAIKVNKTLLLSSGSHGKFLGRLDLKVDGGKIVDYSSKLIPIFSDVFEPDLEVREKINIMRAPYEQECSRAVGIAKTLLYRRGNFNGPWDDVICDSILEERDTEIALSPGFRWGTTVLPEQKITIDDIYSQTSMNYPEVYRMEMTGKRLKEIMEDVCDNLFNIDPFFQQGGDMVRVGGFTYTCAPKKPMGHRITDMRLISSGDLIESGKTYVVGGWGSVQRDVSGPNIYNVLENYILRKEEIKPMNNRPIKVTGL